jgi:hypothetical protein
MSLDNPGQTVGIFHGMYVTLYGVLISLFPCSQKLARSMFGITSVQTLNYIYSVRRQSDSKLLTRTVGYIWFLQEFYCLNQIKYLDINPLVSSIYYVLYKDIILY